MIIRFRCNACYAFEESAETAGRLKVQDGTRVIERVMVHKHQRLCLLNDRLINPCRGVFLTVTDTYE